MCTYQMRAALFCVLGLVERIVSVIMLSDDFETLRL